MPALWIILCVFVLLGLAAFARIRFDICAKEDVTLSLRILGVRIPIYPKKAEKIRVSRFKKGYPKKKEPEKAPAKKEKAKQAKAPIGETVSTVLSLVKKLCARTFGHLRLDVSRIVVTVGASDAAKCAITYGIVSQAVAYLLDYLDHHVRIRKKRSGEISVGCDYTADRIQYDICITLSLAGWQAVDIAVYMAYTYFKGNDIFHLKKSGYGGSHG